MIRVEPILKLAGQVLTTHQAIERHQEIGVRQDDLGSHLLAGFSRSPRFQSDADGPTAFDQHALDGMAQVDAAAQGLNARRQLIGDDLPPPRG